MMNVFNILCLHIGECFVDISTTKDCSDGYCIVSKEGDEFEQICDDNEELEEMFVIQTTYELKKRSEVQNIFFRCKYDKCNSEEIFHQVSELVDNYYDLEPIRNLLVDTTKPLEEENTTSSYQQTTEKQSSTAIMKSSGLQIYCSNTVMYGALIVFIFDIFSFL
jgi:hypothetical protein